MQLLTSKGAAGVTGSGFIVLVATLSAVGEMPESILDLHQTQMLTPVDKP